MIEHEVSPNVCRRCGTRLNAATGLDNSERPSAGSISICFYCGTIAIFTDDLGLREPTVAEVDEILDDPIVARALDRLWGARLARVVEAVGGVEFACGCHTTGTGDLFTLEACSDTCPAARTVVKMIEKSGKSMIVDPEWRQR